MPTTDNLADEPLRTLYVVMTEVLEDATSAQERGDVTTSRLLAEDASIIGRAIGILANRASSES